MKNKDIQVNMLWLFLAFVVAMVFVYIFYFEKVLNFIANVPVFKIEKPHDAYFYSETGVYKQPLILFQLVVSILFATYASWVKHQAPTKMVRIASLFSKFLVVFFMFLGFLSLIVISGFGGMVG